MKKYKYWFVIRLRWGEVLTKKANDFLDVYVWLNNKGISISDILEIEHDWNGD